MTGAEVRKLTDEEIEVELERLQRKLFDMRCQTVSEKIENPSQFGKTRREIARLKTERTARIARTSVEAA